MSFKKYGKQILYILVIIIVIALLFEIYIRIIHWPVPLKNQYPIGMTEFNSERGYSLSPNFTGSFPYDKSIKININSKGLRDYEHEYTKKNGTLRVLVIGDSLTFGIGLNYNDIYTTLLEKNLKKSENVEIIKAGVGGYEFSQEYQFYKDELYKYNPDMVIIETSIGDLSIPDIQHFKKNFEFYGTDLEQDSKFRVFIKKVCHSCVFAYYKFKSHDDTFGSHFFQPWENSSLTDGYYNSLLELKKELDEKNTTLVLVYFPLNWQFENSAYSSKANYLPQDKLKLITSKENISFFDLQPYLDSPGYEKYYQKNSNIYLNSEGSRLVAKILYNNLFK